MIQSLWATQELQDLNLFIPVSTPTSKKQNKFLPLLLRERLSKNHSTKPCDVKTGGLCKASSTPDIREKDCKAEF